MKHWVQQIDKLFHTSNLYYNTVCGKAAEDPETYYRNGSDFLYQQWRRSGRRNFKSGKKNMHTKKELAVMNSLL